METFEVKLNAVSCRLNGKSNAHVYCKIVKLFKIAFEFPSVCKQKQLHRCFSVNFAKFRPATLLKKDPGTGVSL